MAAHGDTLANHGAHASALHATNEMAGKHAAAEHEQATSKLAGTDRHHHHLFNRREPKFGEPSAGFCPKLAGEYNLWPECYAPTKSPKGHT